MMMMVMDGGFSEIESTVKTLKLSTVWPAGWLALTGIDVVNYETQQRRGRHPHACWEISWLNAPVVEYSTALVPNYHGFYLQVPLSLTVKQLIFVNKENILDEEKCSRGNGNTLGWLGFLGEKLSTLPFHHMVSHCFLNASDFHTSFDYVNIPPQPLFFLIISCPWWLVWVLAQRHLWVRFWQKLPQAFSCFDWCVKEEEKKKAYFMIRRRGNHSLYPVSTHAQNMTIHTIMQSMRKRCKREEVLWAFGASAQGSLLKMSQQSYEATETWTRKPLTLSLPSAVWQQSQALPRRRSPELLLGLFCCPTAWLEWVCSPCWITKNKKMKNLYIEPAHALNPSQSSGKNIVAFAAASFSHRLSRSWLMLSLGGDPPLGDNPSWHQEHAMEVTTSADRLTEAVHMRYSATWK